MQSAECRVDIKCRVQNAECRVQSCRGGHWLSEKPSPAEKVDFAKQKTDYESILHIALNIGISSSTICDGPPSPLEKAYI